MQVERVGVHPRIVAQHSELVGRYVVPGSGPIHRTRTTTDCPYCHEPLYLLEGEQAYRVLRVVEQRADGGVIADAEPIPSTHRSLGCAQCKAVFTEPL